MAVLMIKCREPDGIYRPGNLPIRAAIRDPGHAASKEPPSLEIYSVRWGGAA
jgi:hypothetical protein